MKQFSATFLLTLIVLSVSVMWVADKWATTIPEVGAFLLAAIWISLISARRTNLSLSFGLLPLSALVIWAAMQIFVGTSVYPLKGWLSILYWAGNLATFFAALQTFSEAGVRDRFFRRLLIFGFAVAVQASLQALSANGKIFWIFVTEFPNRNFMGPFVYYNQFAAFIELLLPVALYYALTGTRLSVFGFVMVAGMYAGVIVSASRAGFVLSTAELILIPVLLLRRNAISARQIGIATIGMTFTIGLLVLAAGPETLLTRFHVQDPMAIRREFNLSSWKMLQDKPLLGVGMGNWSTAYPAYADFDNGTFANQAHNDWAQWAVEGGIPLLLIMLSFGYYVFTRSLRSVYALGLAAVLVHCCVDYPIQRPAVALVFFAMLGAAAHGVRHRTFLSLHG